MKAITYLTMVVLEGMIAKSEEVPVLGIIVAEDDCAP